MYLYTYIYVYVYVYRYIYVFSLYICIYVNVFSLCILTMYIYQYTALTAALAALTAHRHRPHGVFFSVLRADWTQFFSGACAPTRAIAELIKSVGYTSMVDFDTGGEPHAPERLSHWAPVSIECSIRSHGAAAHTPELYFIGPLYLVTASATFDPEPS